MNALLLIPMLVTQSGYAASPLEVIDAALSVVKVTANDVVYDVGSGDGRICILAAKKYGCKAVGIELDANLVNLSRFATIKNGVTNLVEIKHENALKSDLSKATVVFLYHQTGFLDKLRKQLDELVPGTRVVFLDYPPKWMSLKPAKTIKVGEHHHKIYMWRCGVEDKDTVLISTAKHYPGVRFFRGQRDIYLVQLSQECADLMASRGERGYWQDGHPNWDSRYRRIKSKLGMTGVEVTAFSWPDTSDIFTPQIAYQLFYDWERSSGHWKIVSGEHKRYGEGVARSRSGIWFGAIITAD